MWIALISIAWETSSEKGRQLLQRERWWGCEASMKIIIFKRIGVRGLENRLWYCSRQSTRRHEFWSWSCRMNLRNSVKLRLKIILWKIWNPLLGFSRRLLNPDTGNLARVNYCTSKPFLLSLKVRLLRVTSFIPHTCTHDGTQSELQPWFMIDTLCKHILRSYTQE